MSSSSPSPPSTGNSPHRFNAGPIDSFYDPDFTADISNKMRVPERIVIESNNTLDDPAIIAAAKSQTYHNNKPIWMTVPERILVVGNDSHMSGREQLPELKLENSMIGMGDGDYSSNGEPLAIHLTTPPHSLRLDEYLFPTAGDGPNVQSSATTNGPNSRGSTAASQQRLRRNVVLSGLATNDDDIEIARKESTNESPEYQSYYNSNQSMNDLSGDYTASGGGGGAVEPNQLRRQVRSLSRRVAAIELENQNRHQREVLVYTVGVIYFLIKGLFWIRRQL
ncbi:transport and Golgi organization protein 11-like [Oppia nitens]|uniref:transport and Golgi organization protein 11-like n=1 Tax=Oppia nitens TaxID=1686743 RepID=UPI0023DA9769|nr:transport and Golgi organization protein 11-like [Oppia nitens]